VSAPHRTRIKFCGITTAEDAAAAVAAGADAIGLVFAPSSRQVSIDEACEIVADVPPLIGRIGVFVDADPAFVAEAVERCGLTAVQFHGGESPDICASAPAPAIKVLKVRENGTELGRGALEPYRGCAAAFLLDTYSRNAEGGTGKAFDWQRIAPVPGWAPFVVAGGLDPGNVGAAIAALRPFAVDVSSGVECAPGRKDPALLAAFAEAVRAADEEVNRS